MVTMLTVIYAGAQFFAAPALGKISDRVGRRPVLSVSVFGSAIGLESTFNQITILK